MSKFNVRVIKVLLKNENIKELFLNLVESLDNIVIKQILLEQYIFSKDVLSLTSVFNKLNLNSKTTGNYSKKINNFFINFKEQLNSFYIVSNRKRNIFSLLSLELTDNQRCIMEYYYGVNNPSLKPKEISLTLNVTESYVNSIIKLANLKLYKKLISLNILKDGKYITYFEYILKNNNIDSNNYLFYYNLLINYGTINNYKDDMGQYKYYKIVRMIKKIIMESILKENIVIYNKGNILETLIADLSEENRQYIKSHLKMSDEKIRTNIFRENNTLRLLSEIITFYDIGPTKDIEKKI